MADGKNQGAKPGGTPEKQPVPQHHALAEGQKVDTGCGTGKKTPA